MYRALFYAQTIKATGKIANHYSEIWNNDFVKIIVFIITVCVILYVIKRLQEIGNEVKNNLKENIEKKKETIKKIVLISTDKEISNRQMDKLSKLFFLKKERALTEKEFENQKNKIMKKDNKVKEISNRQISKLTKLLNLKNARILTEKEFEEQKAKIMQKLDYK